MKILIFIVVLFLIALYSRCKEYEILLFFMYIHPLTLTLFTKYNIVLSIFMSAIPLTLTLLVSVKENELQYLNNFSPLFYLAKKKSINKYHKLK